MGPPAEESITPEEKTTSETASEAPLTLTRTAGTATSNTATSLSSRFSEDNTSTTMNKEIGATTFSTTPPPLDDDERVDGEYNNGIDRDGNPDDCSVDGIFPGNLSQCVVWTGKGFSSSPSYKLTQVITDEQNRSFTR